MGIARLNELGVIVARLAREQRSKGPFTQEQIFTQWKEAGIVQTGNMTGGACARLLFHTAMNGFNVPTGDGREQYKLKQIF